MTDSPDDRLAQELAHLPRVQARPDFTRRVLAAARERTARPRRPQLRPLAALLTLAMAAGLALWVGPSPSPEVPESALRHRARVDAAGTPDDLLDREYRSIAEELEDLRRLADEAAPVLYLTSTDEFDVVLDLRPLLDSPQGRTMNAADRRGGPRSERRDG